MGFTICRKQKDVEFLTVEVDRIRRAFMPSVNQKRVRDLFLFQCYSALSYCDMNALRPSDFKTNDMGYIYINGVRLKTKVRFIAILFEDTITIAQKYNYKLPNISNQRYNTNLKIIADICDIRKPLHTHTASHSISSFPLKTNDLQKLNIR